MEELEHLKPPGCEESLVGRKSLGECTKI